ncbi:MAG TPA: hypothetical protein VJV96_05720 [Candidatus Angelobacter sp.]|nr:hypothetical protein [Candidatus Angelobacter sp.]
MAHRSPTGHVLIRIAFPALILISVISVGCGGGSGGGGATPTPTPVASPTPTPTPAPSTGLKMSVADAKVPTGGIYQYQLLLTEPKPIGNSSTRPTIPTGPTGPVRGVAVNDSTGQAVGIAVINGTDISVSIQSPNASLGTDVDYPLLVLTMPVTGTSGSFTVALDPSSTFFVGGSQYSILENVPGTLTIGGTVSITDVVPGGGVIKPGDTIKILGIGFDANTKINMNNVNTMSTNFISSKEIDVTINSLCVPESNPCAPASSMPMDGERIRATNTATNDQSEYFSYDRTDDAPGSSNNALVNLVHPMFSQQFLQSGTFAYKDGGTQFTGIALQDSDLSTGATVKVELLDSAGNSLANVSQVVPARTKLVRDMADFFPSAPAGAVTVRASIVTGPAAGVKMLGMLGDTSTNSVVPVVVTGQ